MSITEFKNLLTEIIDDLSAYNKKYICDDEVIFAKFRQMLVQGNRLLTDYPKHYLFHPTLRSIDNNSLYLNKSLALKICKEIGDFIDKKHESMDGKSISSDPLTGLPYIEQEQISFEGFETVSVAIVDLDDLKKLNNISYDKGDEALKLIASELIKLEEMKCKVFRAHGRNGDEFFVIGYNFQKEDLFASLEECKRGIDSKNISDNIKVTISAGIASFPKDGKDRKDIFSKSNAALQFSKDFGKKMITKIDELPEIEIINFRFEGELNIRKGSKILVNSWRNHSPPNMNSLEAVEVIDIDNEIPYTSRTKGTTMTAMLIKKDIYGVVAGVKKPYNQTLFSLKVLKNLIKSLEIIPKDFVNPICR